MLRADAAGTMQALVGLWQIFLARAAFRVAKADATLPGVLKPFAEVQQRPRSCSTRAATASSLLLAATGLAAGRRRRIA